MLACAAAATSTALQLGLPAAPIIGGQGAFKYQYMPEKLVLPPGAEIRDAHGLELDSANNIYLTYGNWADGKPPNNGTDRNCKRMHALWWAPGR